MTVKTKIYLDYAATTPIDSKVLKTMMLYLKEDFGNSSSLHQYGQKTKNALEKARQKIADFLNCSSKEIVFTGSATEANNLVIKGIIGRIERKDKNFKPHIITSKIEHPSILEPCRYLEKKGLAEITYLPVSRQGMVFVSVLEKAIKSNTVLVSIMYANNEIGTIQPIQEIGRLIKRANQTRNNKIFFHTDAVQAINYLNCDVQKLGNDLLTLSGHKIYGPKGIGVLFIKKGTIIEPQIFGGGHEFGLRAGTENIAGIIGIGTAISEIQTKKFKNNIKLIKKLRDKLISGILKTIPESKLNGSRIKRIPNNVNVSFLGVEGEALLIILDREGIAVSTGSACSSKKLEPSYVLLSLGLSYQQIHSSLRITLGKDTTKKEIDRLLKFLYKAVKRLRQISGYRKNKKYVSAKFKKY